MPSRRREIAFSRIVDLSQDIGPGTQMFPAYPRPSMIPWTTREVHGFLAEALFLVSHTGTHIDAPWHFEPRGKKIHELPLERFLAPGHVLDLRNGRAKARISPSQLRAARVSLGRPIRKGDAVLLWTGWERLRGRRAYLFDNPGLSRSAAEELVGWGLSLVGIDTANIDHPSAGEYPAHHTLLRSGVLVMENVVNLARVGSRPFHLVAFPLKLVGTTGSPVRAVALVE